MRTELSSRERVMTAIGCREPDHVPLLNRGGIPRRYFHKLIKDAPWSSQFERIEESLRLGIDECVSIDPPRPTHHGVKVRIRKEHSPSERYPLLIKECETAKGTLSKAVRQTPDWPHGDDVPLFDDYGVSPGRSVKNWIENSEDLEAFRCLFRDLSESEVKAFEERLEPARRFAATHGVATAAIELTYLGTAVMLLCGFVGGVSASIRRPDFLNELLDLIHSHNMEIIRLITDVGGVDLFIHNGWYDSTDFWSPRAYRAFILPRMLEEMELVHKHKMEFGYTMASGAAPLLGTFKENGIDLLYGIDPVQGGFDMSRVKREIGDKVCLWGGVNAHVTLECGDANEVRGAVKEAITTLGPRGGFMLSSVGAIYPEAPIVNIEAMIEAWREAASYPIVEYR